MRTPRSGLLCHPRSVYASGLNAKVNLGRYSSHKRRPVHVEALVCLNPVGKMIAFPDL